MEWFTGILLSLSIIIQGVLGTQSVPHQMVAPVVSIPEVRHRVESRVVTVAPKEETGTSTSTPPKMELVVPVTIDIVTVPEPVVELPTKLPEQTLSVSLRQNASKIFGANCSYVFIDVVTTYPTEITFLNPETKIEEKLTSPATFTYRPQATSTKQLLAIYTDNIRQEKEISVVGSLLTELPPHHIRETEEYFVSSNGEKMEKSGMCL